MGNPETSSQQTQDNCMYEQQLVSREVHHLQQKDLKGCVKIRSVVSGDSSF